MILLDRYIRVATLKVLALVTAGLTVLFSLLELVNQLHDVGKGRYRLIDAFTYVLLTVPARLLQLMPVSMLLATLFGLGTLASNNELTVMRATGVSRLRIAGSVFKLLGAVLVVLFLAAQFVIPSAEQSAQAGRTSRLYSSPSLPLRTGNSFWAEGYDQGQHAYLNVRRFANENDPVDIYIYLFAGDGKLESFIHAERAELRADGTWLLSGVSRTRFSDAGSETDRLDSLSWHSFLPPQQVRFLILPPESMPPVQLYRYVRHLRQQRQPAARYAQELWTKINLPFVMAGMIMIAIPFVFGPLRTHGTGQRIMVGALIGIVFTLVQQLTNYAGLLLGLNAALTATMPSLMLAATALYLGARVRA